MSQGSSIHSISIAADRLAIIGCGKFILNYDINFQLVNYISERKGYSVHSATMQPSPKRSRYTRMYLNEQLCYYQSNANSVLSFTSFAAKNSPQGVFIFSPSNHHSQMAVSSKYIAISNVQSYHIMIYHRTTTVKSNFNFPATSWIRSLCFDSNGDLLILDAELSRVTKYTINDSVEPTLRWQCEGIAGPYAMCINSRAGDESIYVSATGRKVYIIKDGKLTVNYLIAVGKTAFVSVAHLTAQTSVTFHDAHASPLFGYNHVLMFIIFAFEFIIVSLFIKVSTYSRTAQTVRLLAHNNTSEGTWGPK